MEKAKYIKIIYRSSIIFRIKKSAPKVLEILKKVAIEKGPNMLLEIDIQDIEKAMVNAFARAFCSLFTKEHEFTHNIHYSGGYVLGFFSSNLWIHLVGEYIYPKIPEYQNLMFLRALYFYSKHDHLFDYKFTNMIRIIYSYFISTNKPYVNDDISDIKKNNTESNLIFLEDYKTQNRTYANKKFVQSLSSYLEILLVQEHHKSYDKVISRFTSMEAKNIKGFFEIDEIKEVIEHIKRS